MKQLGFFLGMVLLLIACNTRSEQPKPIDAAQLKNPLIKANKELVELEETDIENYIRRHKWKMDETGSGLRYMIYEHGNGRQVEEGLVVQCGYEAGLLTGTTCYTSKEFGPKEFLVGRGGVESGLEEVILLLREGDKVKIILPSHLAFGLVGDDECIPKKAVVVYDLQVMNVLNPINRN
ncbi:MAG: FKBP-type peptidyl-prolyl cis-trans isomerase [Flavobacteriales bacterium]|nr:FKBP-type peptidyl-prolyl cis-trans isomerase [Flavobacteriales bacterium]